MNQTEIRLSLAFRQFLIPPQMNCYVFALAAFLCGLLMSANSTAQSLLLNRDFNDPSGTDVTNCFSDSADNNAAPNPWITNSTPDYCTESDISFDSIYHPRTALSPPFDISPDGGCFMGFRDLEGMTQSTQVIADASTPLTYTFFYTEYIKPNSDRCDPITEFRVNSTSPSTGTLIGRAPNVGELGGPSFWGKWATVSLPSFVPADYGVSDGSTMDIYFGSANPACEDTWAFVDGLTIAAEPIAAKVVHPTNISDGDIATFTITIDNTDTNAALQTNTVAFEDDLPSNLEVAPTPNAATTCGNGIVTALAGSSSISIKGGDVSVASTCIVTFDVTNVEGEINNDCSANPTAFTNSSTNLSLSESGSIDFSGVMPACLEVIDVNTSLTLIKSTSVDPVMAGVPFDYVLTVTDVADGKNALDVIVSDTLNDSLTFNSIAASDNGTTDSTNVPTVNCNWSTIPDGASRTCTIKVTP